MSNVPAGKAEGIVKFGEHEYQKVGLRLKKLRDEHPDWSVTTEILEVTDDKAVVRAEITDENGKVRGTGHAEKFRHDVTGPVKAPLELCETKAVGRALANAGWAGVEIASAEEMDEYRSELIVDYFLYYNELVRRHWDAITQFKRDIADGLDRSASQQRLEKGIGSRVEFEKLWKAPSKGGIFTTFERDKNQGSAKPPEDYPDPDMPEQHPKMIWDLDMNDELD